MGDYQVSKVLGKKVHQRKRRGEHLVLSSTSLLAICFHLVFSSTPMFPCHKNHQQNKGLARLHVLTTQMMLLLTSECVWCHWSTPQIIYISPFHSPDICLWIGWTLSVWSQAHCWNISLVSSVDLPSTVNTNIWKTCAKLWAPQHWCRRQSTSRHSGAPPCPFARPPPHPRSYSACASIVETVWIKNSTIFKIVLVSWYIQMKLKIVLKPTCL